MTKIVFVHLAVLVVCIWTAHSKPWEPTPRPEQSWMDRHNGFVSNTQNNAEDIKIVFTGSSSIEHWGTDGREIWDAKYAPLGAVNYGIGGDKIEHCLWRIMNGEIEALNPKILVLYCGSNNIPSDPVNEDIVRGITTTLDEIARRLPETKILYVNFNPRGDRTPVNETFERITAINEQVIALDDGDKINVFDMFDELIESWGQIRTDLYLSDKLHLNKAGYEVWDASWNSTFYKLWNDDV